MSTNDESAGVTFIWTIENLDRTWTGNIESPVFLSHSLHGTEWKLNFYPIETSNNEYISLNLTRCGLEDKGTERIILDCELSILGEYGVPIQVMEIENIGFLRGRTWWCKNFILEKELFDSKRRDFLFLNILTIRCRLWRRFRENTIGEIHFSCTKIERFCFVWTIEDFCRLKPYQRKQIYLKRSHAENSVLTFEFFIGRNDEAEIEISPTEPRKIQTSCYISVLDGCGEYIKSEHDWHAFELPMEDWGQGKNCFRYQKVWRFPSFITKSSLVRNKRINLPMGRLSLRVECYIYTDDANTIESTSQIPSQNFQVTENLSNTRKHDKQCMTELEITSTSKLQFTKFEEKACGTEISTSMQKCDKQCMTESEGITFELSNCFELEKKVYGTEINNGSYDIHSHSSFMHDLQCMYEEGILSDFILRSSNNKDFRVHKNILSARSPVFRAMFTTAMKEKDGDFIDVPDVDAATLQRMLQFVYFNRMDEDMQWENALNLYFAADKYAIDDLKRASCSLLKARLRASNACEILVHSDLHGDQDLKSFTKDFIVDNDSEVIGSEEWNKLLKSNIHLTVEIFSELYLKKMKKYVNYRFLGTDRTLNTLNNS